MTKNTSSRFFRFGALTAVLATAVVLASASIAGGQDDPAQVVASEQEEIANCDGHVVTVILANGDQPTAGDDIILGTDGPDVINAGDGNDIICSGEGDDIINAGDGADIIIAGNGNNVIRAGNGADDVSAGDGDDQIFAGQGRDEVRSRGGDDFISGGRGKDLLVGGAGNDDIRGNEGTDDLRGGVGDDTLRGGQKADSIEGDDGDDVLIGGTRPDLLNGNRGLDIYVGGGGRDVCIPDRDGLTEQITSCELDAEIREIVPGVREDQRLITPGGGGVVNGFGEATAVVDDTIFVGADGVEIDGVRGAVFVYRQTDDGVVLHQTITPPNPGDSSRRFGRTLALDGDTLVVGGFAGPSVYTQINDVWQLQQTLNISDELFSSAPVIDGDTIAVGVTSRDDLDDHSPTVLIFNRSNGTWTEQQELSNPTPPVSQDSFTWFGATLAIEDDTLFVSDAVISTVYIYELADGTWSLQQSLTNPDTINTDGFGSTIVINNGTLVITDPATRRTQGVGQFQDGSAFVFTETEGVWTEQQEIVDQISQDSGTVAIDGNTMAIASDDPRGSIKLYTLEDGTWIQQEQFVRSNAIEDGSTGLTVALDGDLLLGGAHFGELQATVYVYDLQALTNP